jgi:hypothetical protein
MNPDEPEDISYDRHQDAIERAYTASTSATYDRTLAPFDPDKRLPYEVDISETYARTGDPDTSKEAAELFEGTGQGRQILQAVRPHTHDGLTGHAIHATNIKDIAGGIVAIGSVQSTITKLRRMGYLTHVLDEDGNVLKRRNPTKRRAEVYRITAAGLARIQ